MLLNSPYVDLGEFARLTGWTLKPEGMCKGAVCVPLPREVTGSQSAPVDLLAEHLGMALVVDGGHGVWSLGPEAGPKTKRLTSAVLPDIVLSDFDNRSVSLASFRGKKVLLVSWASY